MKQIAAFFVALQFICLGVPASAQHHDGAAGGTMRSVAIERWVEEWDPVRGEWVRVTEATVSVESRAPQAYARTARGASRYALPIESRRQNAAIAQYGPFVVTSETRAQMVGSTDLYTPAQFDAMLRDFPRLAVLDMVEAPGTSNDIANLAVARRIRASGLATHVPDSGSVRSGAVELFLAGVTRTVDDGATFAVHSWLDNHGREADDFPADHPAHRLYLDFYVEMGMSEAQAREFYAMTNSVPHAGALWLQAADMRPWLREDRSPAFRFAATERPGVKVPGMEFIAQAPLPAIDYEWGAVEIDVAFPMIDYADLTPVGLAHIAPDALTRS